MCGIIGSRGKRTESEIKAAAASIAHRGPDAFGCYTYEDVVFAHHRLAILDLSEKGAQPYHFEHLSMVFNGELYNFKSVREKLIKEGYGFNSDSDTEVLIKAFHKWGPKAIDHFVGMFAFALLDKNENSIYIFRDRVGVKPLYYSLEDGLVFGSELRTIMPFLKNRQVDHHSVYEYFRVGYISEDKTIFNSAKKLLPAHYLKYKDGKATIHKYWEPVTPGDEQHSAKEWQDKVHQLMIDAFSLRMVSDVPVGVFLSGGIDSSLVSSILQKNYGNIHTFTISFNDERYDEAPWAKKIANHLGTTHTEFTLDVNDAHEVLDKFYDIYDEPFADSSGIPSTVVSKLAAKAGIKVVLSADGGDELFGGYSHYQTSINLFNKINRLPAPARTLTGLGTLTAYKTNLFRKIHRGNIEHKLATLNELVNKRELGDFYHAFLANQATHELDRLVAYPVKEKRAKLLRQDMGGLMLHDIHHYLPDDLLVKMDRATMYNSIEGREPILDHRLIELAVKVPLDLKVHNGETKWILKQILGEYVPTEYFMRPKKGFSIPIFKWFSQHLDHMFDHYLSPDKIEATGVLRAEEVANEHNRYKWNKRNGKESNIEKMWRLLSFMMWWEKWNNN